MSRRAARDAVTVRVAAVMTSLIRSPELAELRAFCAAVDLGSIGRAARLLRTSQPALSKRLRALEVVAGAQLLERSPRGVTPTAAGARLHAEARKVVAGADSVEALMGGLAQLEAPPIRLASSPTIAEFVLPASLVEFEALRQRRAPIELFIANSYAVRELVRNGRADLGALATGPGGKQEDALVEVPLCEDEILIAVPERHPWAARQEVDLAEFAATPMVMRDPDANSRRVVDSALAERGLSLAPPLAEVGSTTVAKATAIAEGAPLLVSRLAVGEASEGLRVRRVRELRFPRRFVLVFGSQESVPEAARALADHLLSTPPAGHGVADRASRAPKRS